MDLARRLRDLARRHRIDAVSGVSPSHIWRAVMRWEAGDSQPSARYQLLLAYAYAESDDLATVGAGAGLDRLLDAFQLMGVSTDRRTFLRSMAAAASSAGLPALVPELPDRAAWALAHPDKVDVDTVESVALAVGDLIQRNEDESPLSLAASFAPYHRLVRRLAAGSQAGEVRAAVLRLSVEAFHFAWRLSYNLRDRGGAARGIGDADRFADDLEDGAFRRWWLASRAKVARRDGDHATALTLVRAACRAVPAESDYVGYWVHCAQAQIAGGHGDEAAARRSLDLARLFADRIAVPGATGHDPLAFLFPEARFGGPDAVPARISAYEGTCCLRAGLLDQAERAFADVLDRLQTGLDGQRVFALADLATVHIRRRDPEGACARLHEAIDLIEPIGGDIPLQRIHRARRELAPWATVPAVRDLDEKLFGPLEL